MVKKLVYIFGLPGSGKSLVMQNSAKLLDVEQPYIHSIDDYVVYNTEYLNKVKDAL